MELVDLRDHAPREQPGLALVTNTALAYLVECVRAEADHVHLPEPTGDALTLRGSLGEAVAALTAEYAGSLVHTAYRVLMEQLRRGA